ncbi:hypothetical protein SRABI118_01221 [Massilia sp. Bi118]|uniref:ubiquinone anaerobic biosynthesis protein UbiV n=1 Tax=Massilia sp. Bi118 TaxID=2822346 RepID=UPI001DC0D642|nr:U32 family peptidase [Massilia sp. Bi118]CAH0180333.1 hypothetical protein SRABI118_01221 [Massilia sp. Bi118]
MKIALGPLQYYWPRETVFDFYDGMAGAPLDIVYLGETVCSRRHELRLAYWLALAERLAGAGKQVVLSTQVLIESGADLNALRRIADNGRFLVEANDMGAVGYMEGRPFVAGPHLNMYNNPSLKLMADAGAVRWVVPFEMPAQGLAAMRAGFSAGLETEVFAYGRMPLAFSARCLTARQQNLPKDDCRFSCIAHPDGMLMQTQEGQPFLVLNGIQTQAAQVCNLVEELDAMRVLGVGVVRLSPQAAHMGELTALFRAAIAGEIGGREAHERMAPLMPGGSCNGFWHGKPGMERHAA